MTWTTSSGWSVIAGVYKPAGSSYLSNAGFEHAPAFTAASNTAGKWINGTAGGSSTEIRNRWAIIAKTGTGTSQFDTAETHSGSYSMKLSTTATASSIRVSNTHTTTFSDFAVTGYPVTGNTQYAFSFWVKTTANSGSATTGAKVVIIERYSGGSPANYSSATVNTTQGWTYYSIIFTTNTLTTYLTPDLQVVGNDGTGTLLMDAWFDDLVLVKNPQAFFGVM
jgi:hypothetical protein